MSGAHLLPLADLVEDKPVDDHPIEDQFAPTVPDEEPQIPVSIALSVTVPLPASHASSAPPVPPVPLHSTGLSASALHMQSISISPHAFLAIMDAVCTFSTTSASFPATHTALAERMARVEPAIAHTTNILTQNNVILLQIQNHLGLPQTSPSVPAQASSAPTAATTPGHPAQASSAPTTVAAPGHPTQPAASLDLLASVAAVDTSPVAPSHPASSVAAQPTHDDDDIPLAVHT